MPMNRMNPGNSVYFFAKVYFLGLHQSTRRIFL
jgi:hypothetical protein